MLLSAYIYRYSSISFEFSLISGEAARNASQSEDGMQYFMFIYTSIETKKVVSIKYYKNLTSVSQLEIQNVFI